MVVYHDKNLIINYIPRNISDLDLINLFSSAGAIKYCRIIRDRESGSSFGFGFCEYEDSESAIRAINRFNGYRLADKVLKVSMAKLQGRLVHSSNLFVKYLPLTLTEEEISEQFNRFGMVVQCRVLRDRDTDNSKGSAYVLMANRSDAEKAKKMLDGTIWPGSNDSEPLCIKFATPPYRQPGGDTFGSSKSFTSHNAPSNSLNEICHQDQVAAQLFSLQTGCGTLNDSMLPLQLSENIYMQQTRDNICGLPQSSCIPSATNNCGIVWPSDYIPADAKPLPAAVQLTPIISPQYFTQQAVAPNIWPGNQNNFQSFGTSFGSQFDGFTNGLHGYPFFTGFPNQLLPLFGIANIFDTRANLNPYMDNQSIKKSKGNKIDKTCTSIYVYNIGNLMTEAQLTDLFSRFGFITNVSIPKDPKTNFTRNFGFVTFTTVQSALEAILGMNGALFAGRRLQVSFRKSKGSKSGNLSDSSKTSNTAFDNDVSPCNGSHEVCHIINEENTCSRIDEPNVDSTETFAMRLKTVKLDDTVKSDQNAITS